MPPPQRSAIANKLSTAVPARQIDSDRGMRNTSSWKPRFGRRQSWDKEEQKHALQMTGLQDVKACPGFSENK